MNKTNIEWTDYRAGYIAGMTEGDGTFKMPIEGKTYRESQWYWRVALLDITILKRLRQYLRRLGIRLSIGDYKIKPIWLYKIETRKKKSLNTIYECLRPQAPTREYSRGYLAGIFDAEGNWYGSNLRIYNSSKILRNKVISYANDIGFTFTEEDYPSKKGNGVRLKGDRFDKAKFWCVIKSVKSREYLSQIFERDL